MHNNDLKNDSIFNQIVDSDINNRNINGLALALYEVPYYTKFNDAYEAAKQMINSEDEIRRDKVKLAQERFRSGYYHKKEVLLKVADKILNYLVTD